MKKNSYEKSNISKTESIKGIDSANTEHETHNTGIEKGYKPVKTTVTIIVLVAIVIIFFVLNNYIDRLNAKKCVPVDNSDYLIGVDSIKISDGVLKLSGWCFKNGIDTVKTKSTAQVMVILMNVSNQDEKYFMSSSITKNEKLNEMFPLKSIDYTYGGFEAEIKTSKLDLDSINYEILFSKMDYPWDSDQYCLTGIRSGYRIINGELKSDK